MLARQRHVPETVERICQRAHTSLTQQQAIECLAADLTLAAETLGTLTGQTTADDLLGEYFQFLYWKISLKSLHTKLSTERFSPYLKKH